MLRLQQTIGNSGVLQLMKAAANSVIQGKFVYDKESTLFFDEDTGRHYRLLGTVPYGESGRRVYQLEGDIDDVLVYQDTMELAERLNHPPEPIADPLSGSPSGVFSGDSAPGDNSAVTFGKPGVKRIFKLSEKESDDDSQFEESDDDDKTELNEEQMMKMLVGKGKSKRRKLLSGQVKVSDGRREMHDPRSRKALIAHRQSSKSKLSLMEKQEYFMIGDEVLRLGDGRGYFIQPGGNTREEDIKEPPAEYNAIFEDMKKMGADPNVDKLFEMATGKKRDESDSLSDYEVATISLYYMNNDASAIAKGLGSRSQLLEHLGKLTAITGLSEFARSMEAMQGEEEQPYDATVLVKQGLMSVIEGKKTLKQIFYQGTGGEDSVFLGAPSEIHSSKGIGGAAILRDPFGHKQNLERQMSIFPKQKGEFKKAVNRLKSQVAIELPPMTEEDKQKMEEQVKQEQVEEAEQLLKHIKRLRLPKRKQEYNDFLNSPKGEYKKFEKKIKKLTGRFEGNEAALAQLKLAKVALKQIHSNALTKL